MGRQHARHSWVFAWCPGLPRILDQRTPSIACWAIVAAVLAGAAIGREPAVAIYLASFVYYGLYWYAFAWGIDSFGAFKRDAMLLKAVSVAALAFVYLQAPPDFVSLGVIGLGILLNARAASVLGIDRTCYGHELAGLAARRITEFPYSLMSHPMIVGNVIAFGGTLLNPTFRAAWWPLAALHVVLNLALLAMERAGTRRRPASKAGGPPRPRGDGRDRDSPPRAPTPFRAASVRKPRDRHSRLHRRRHDAKRGLHPVSRHDRPLRDVRRPRLDRRPVAVGRGAFPRGARQAALLPCLRLDASRRGRGPDRSAARQPRSSAT